MRFPRSSGLLLHPTSLPGPYGIGDFGDEAYRFADFLVASGQRLWQVLPLGPTGYGDSPYACYSAFAGNTLLVNPDRLLADGLLKQEDLDNYPRLTSDRVDFERVNAAKRSLLAIAFDSFEQSTDAMRSAFEHFCSANAEWLDDYAMFCVFKELHLGKLWSDWDARLARRDEGVLAQLQLVFADQIDRQKFFQFLFFRQWSQLKSYCNQRGIRIIGDIPIFVAEDSADVWTNPDQFKLDEERRPIVVAGVPPDYFSETGQLWGNPIYNWDRMKADGFSWWIKRVRAALQMFDVVRIDHFRGFAASWEIPAGDKTAERGRWVNVPGRELFAAVRSALGELPIIAEDLGVITPDVEKLRDDLDFPGMQVLQFAFGGDQKNLALPHNFRRNLVVYTGTHDNDTTVGWFKSEAGEGSTRAIDEVDRERQFCLRYLNTDGKEIHWDFIRAALASVASVAIVPVQDVLGRGNEARMNLPNSTSGNWSWRMPAGRLTEAIAARLRELTWLYGRGAD
jgi:4-alpha-glucanotransferase